MNILASLLNLAGPDLLIILLIVLLLFGAKKLPELARGMGQAVREFTSAKDDFERELHRSGEPPVRTPAEQQAHQPQTAQQVIAASPGLPVPPVSVADPVSTSATTPVSESAPRQNG